MTNFRKIDNNEQLVMFTGGRDSTLTAVNLMLKKIPVHLFTASSGCGLYREPLEIRVEELRKRFGNLVVVHHVENISGTFRQLAITTIEHDILKYKKNLVLLGEKLAIHVHAIDYCHRNGISICNDGITNYQSEFPEQRDCAKQWMQEFMLKYKILQQSPVYELATSENIVKNNLFQAGVSPKSLEGVTIFADSFSTPSNEDIINYLMDKEALADTIISFISGGTLVA